MEKTPIALLNYRGSVNCDVDYEIIDGGGIKINGFELDGQRFCVQEIIQYKPWNFGRINPGAGQMGIYRLVEADNQEQIALIQDYRANEGDWRIFLLDLAPTEKAMKERLKDKPSGFIFEDYLWA